MKPSTRNSYRIVRTALVLATAALGLVLTQCEAHHPITAQYVAQGRHAHSVTVLPIDHPDISAEKAREQAELIAKRIRDFHPDVLVEVGSTRVGQPVRDVLKQAKANVYTRHFIHGHVWEATPKRPYDEIEITERITRDGREVWSLSAQFDADASGSQWQSAMDDALDRILARLPGSGM